MMMLLVTVLILIIGVFVVIYYLIKNKKEDAFSSTAFTTGLGLIVSSFGSMQDKILPAIGLIKTSDDSQAINTIIDKASSPNYLQLTVGFILLILAWMIHVNSRNKIFILNVNGYRDMKIEQYYQSLRLGTFEFKEREIDFICLFQKGITEESTELIISEIARKVNSYKDESKQLKRGYTGIAPIPFIMIVGTFLQREGIDEYFEFNKFNNTYCKLSSKPFVFKTCPKLELKTDVNSINTSINEVVLAIELTTLITDIDLVQFSAMPIVRLRVPTPKDNVILYKKQIYDYRDKIYQTLETIKSNTMVTRIHIVYSGQSCLALELGKVIDDNRMPEIISYQYSNQSPNKYPWGIIINGNNKGKYIC